MAKYLEYYSLLNALSLDGEQVTNNLVKKKKKTGSFQLLSRQKPIFVVIAQNVITDGVQQQKE